jgi:hypothetical protein
MAERKPPGLGWERWIDRQIREANRKGVAGSRVMLRPFDVESIVQEWHKQHP